MHTECLQLYLQLAGIQETSKVAAQPNTIIFDLFTFHT
jgi:hypothetical protein